MGAGIDGKYTNLFFEFNGGLYEAQLLSATYWHIPTTDDYTWRVRTLEEAGVPAVKWEETKYKDGTPHLPFGALGHFGTEIPFARQ